MNESSENGVVNQYSFQTDDSKRLILDVKSSGRVWDYYDTSGSE